MVARPIEIESEIVRIHKAIVEPDFTSRTVLVADAWDYVSLWLRRGKFSDAEFYWEQARQFHAATQDLPNTSAPLTAYYCFLNAVKTLLTVKNVDFSDSHGLGKDGSSKRKISLKKEKVVFLSGGIFGALRSYFKESSTEEKHSLKVLLYNLPFIHRAFTLTYTSLPEIFIPLSDPQFVRKDQSDKTWFCGTVSDRRHQNEETMKSLPSQFERDLGHKDEYVIRMKSRFKWKDNDPEGNLDRLKRYHLKVRKHLYYIHGPTRLWYIKTSLCQKYVIDYSAMTITLAAMHRLSELARYNPMLLARHLESRHNWLLSEFIATATNQFIDDISSEITGQVFMIPGRTGVT